MDTEQDNNKQKNLAIKILIVVILILLIFLIKQCNAPQETAVIVDGEEPVQEITNGQVRIKMNPSITIAEDTMQNLEFCNYNEGRLMKLKITTDDKQIYESQFVKPGEILKADIIDTENLKEGINEAVAEVYTYSLDEEQIGQTNVKIQICLK